MREGVSSGCEGARRGEGGWFGVEELSNGRRGLGRYILGEEDISVVVTFEGLAEAFKIVIDYSILLEISDDHLVSN